MAATHLPPPGTRLGPCADECAHLSCTATRAFAARACRACGQPLDYGRWFYVENAGTVIHALCLLLFQRR